ncbi:hypothetical protein GTW43_12230 [Streptomyces sp. SID5785]|nr:hypothetical protein [Streptomyces sp. SID5785]
MATLGQQGWSKSTRRPPARLTTMPPLIPSEIAAAGEREPHVVPRLRRIGAEWLRHSCWMPEERVENVLVVLSELLTNAVLHGKGHSVGYRSWSPQPGLIRFEIDSGTETEEPPRPQMVPPTQESGRGLLLTSKIVEELGGDWGFTSHGATAWCCLPIHDEQPASGRKEL